MEILHLEDLGDTECRLVANAVVLVLGEYQISIATYLRGLVIYPYVTFEINPSNIFLITVLTASGLRVEAAVMLKP